MKWELILASLTTQFLTSPDEARNKELYEPHRGKAFWVAFALLLSAQCVCMAQRPASTSGPAASALGRAVGDSEVVLPRDHARQVYVQTLASYLKSHDQAAAERGFLKATQIDLSYAPAWFNLGVFAEASKNWVKAENYFNQYLRVAPNGPDAGRAKDQLQILAKYEGGTIDRAAEKQAQYDAMVQRARGFLAVKLFREAIAEAGRAQAADGSRWEAYAVIALCLTRQNKTAEAAKFGEMALDRAPLEKRDELRRALAP
jgi:Tfp pilus assembly protein PilF